MAKKKILNGLGFHKKHLANVFIGKNGRYGFMEKLFKDFTPNETAEFYISHNAATRAAHMTGYLHPDFKNSDFDETPPVKPNTNEETA